ncbi:MAG: TonB-dependent receptor plug domain-containing protein [Gemmatimonadota bacterium]
MPLTHHIARHTSRSGYGLPVVVALLLCPVARLHAQVATLPPVRVSAPPVIQGDSIDRYGALRTTVGADQIRDLDAIDLAAALRRVPGVTISRWNPVGAFGGGSGGGVFVRGHGTSRPGGELKTFIDDVPFYMGVWNHPLLDLLPVNAMDAITVHKGPQPQVVGNTFSAIRLSSRAAQADGVHGDVSVASGAFNTLVQQANLSLKTGRLGIAAAQGFARSDGHRPDADGQLANGLLRVDLAISSALRATFTGMLVGNSARDPGIAGQPSSRTGRYDTRGSLLSLALHHTAGSAARGLRSTLQVYRSAGDGDWYDQPAPDGNTLASFALQGLRLRGELTPWRGGSIVAGLDVDEIDGDVRFDRVAPGVRSTFEGPTLRVLQPHLAIANRMGILGGWAWTPSVGVRAYDHNTLADEIAPHAGLVIEHENGLRLRAQIARGINYPGLDAAAISALVPALGASWQNLSPERMLHSEVGASFGYGLGKARRVSVDAVAFRDDVSERYLFAFTPASVPPSFRNLGAYRMRGIETSVRLDAGAGVALFGSGTWLEPSLASLPSAPARSFSGGAVWDARRWRLSVDANGQTGMFVNTLGRAASATNTQRVNGFSVWHGRLAVPVSRRGARTELFVSADNLLDRAYTYLPGYPMPGRWFTFGARAEF